MAHEIDQTTGRAAVMVVGQAPWHRLGVNVAAAQTSDDAIRLAGLDWTVEQWPLSATDGEKRTACTEHVANVRTDTGAVLGVVGTGYTVFQNRDAFDFMDALVSDRLAMYETAGSLKGGRQVWMMARIPAELRATDSDVVLPYALLSNSHDGSRALRVIPTAVRVVCQNTLTLALGRNGGQGVVIRHCESLGERITEARQALGIVTERLKQHETELQLLASRMMTSVERASFFETVVAGTALQEKGRKQLLDTFNANLDHETNNVPGIRDSAWAAYNAVSWYADHQAKALGKTDTAKAESRLASMWFGTSSGLKQRAFDAALQLVSA